VEGKLLEELRAKLQFVTDEWLAEAGKKAPEAAAALAEYKAAIPVLAKDLNVKP
jgi:hypothetical protein